MNVYLGAPEVTLPLDLAIIYAAEQNFALDVKRGIVGSTECWQYEYGAYVNEAYELLVEDHQNYLPHDENYPLIRVADAIGMQEEVLTDRSQSLLEIFHCYYRKPEDKWAVRPEPTLIKDKAAIDLYLESITESLEVAVC